MIWSYKVVFTLLCLRYVCACDVGVIITCVTIIILIHSESMH